MKEKYHDVKCEVLATNSTDVRVKIWEGPCNGGTHKYKHDKVCKVESVLESSIAGDGAETVEESHGSAAVATPIEAITTFDVSAVFGDI